MNAEYDAYIRSEAWGELKQSHPDRRACVACERPDDLQLHHMRYPANIWDTRASDCCWLCEACHEMFHRACTGERKKYQAWATTSDRTVMLIRAQREEEGMTIAGTLEFIFRRTEISA